MRAYAHAPKPPHTRAHTQVNYLILLFEPKYLYFTTCSTSTAIDTVIRLYDTCPSTPGAVMLQDQNPNFFCSVLEYEANNIGTFWLSVEGARNDQEGNYQLEFRCSGVPTDVSVV